ncbi:fumarate reductase/succinate dehydrogenase flavoprotein subunit [Halorhodospira halochloris]|uniref:fumarate reductase/succinate dehydrogenase flavoprotein subunit n=1 Tax=Halorhodospira halochloris TaxID=1052 RepID=UPI001EE97EAC|nr:fumarate reductase/succinate dehydrogenase flavoprotein subunit [Halorhodospira halochloris]MCG5548006.1 fumarate reductase/succinate dehydrogenase flavoprotein subunit [Halorhodospira halochloris]
MSASSATDNSSPLLDSRIPPGALSDKWQRHQNTLRLVSPANRRRFEIIVVGSGLAGASAAAALAEMGYRVRCITFHDSPRRAHSVSAQGGINAAKDYGNDSDSIERLFQDTIKGGDFRAREANVYRLAEVANSIIDHCVAQGVPFNRDYGGLLDVRSFGGAQVARTFYTRGQTGQQLLLGAYQALMRQVDRGQVTLHPRTEMLDLVLHDGQARGVVCRDLLSGQINSYSGHAVVLASGGYANVYYLTTNAKACNSTALWRAHRRGAFMANPCFTQIHPTCIPPASEQQGKLTLMSESLRNDGRVWVPQAAGDKRPPNEIPESERDYFLERKYPAFGNLAPRDISSRAAKEVVDEGRGVGPSGVGVYLDLADSIARLGKRAIAERYGNLFEMYQMITGDDPWQVPMRIYPAPHYTMGGLWVDYNLMSTIPGLFVIGEANFSDHGANRLGASALMQGLADGYFILPSTLTDYLAGHLGEQPPATDHPAFQQTQRDVAERLDRLHNINGSRSADSFHRQLGKLMWEGCGMAREATQLRELQENIGALRQEFYKDLAVPGSASGVNQELEKAARVEDFFELAELMVRDALEREESCGGHFRVEHQSSGGEALRDDSRFAHVTAWEYRGAEQPAAKHHEQLSFEHASLQERSYK